jgi:PEGA domain-containing protein
MRMRTRWVTGVLPGDDDAARNAPGKPGNRGISLRPGWHFNCSRSLACLTEVLVLRKTLCVSLLTLLAAAALPHEAEAQRRVIRRSAPRVYIAARPYYPVYYSPFFSGWYGAGWYGWPGWYPYGFYGQYYPYYPYRYDDGGSARLEVKPRDAQVYVDGYFVGTVDDFDGWLQRLHVPYGEHDVQIYMPGYRTLREKVLFRPGATLRISGALEPLPPGSPEEPRPAPSPGSEAPRRGGEYPRSPRGGYPAEQGPRREAPRAPRQDQPSAENFGALAIRVQPGDAEVLIDGDRWEAPPSGERLVVQLAEGEHRVEIRRSGYRTYSTTIRVRRGDTAPLNVSLTRQEVP